MKAQSNIKPEKIRIENLGETSDVILTENIVEKQRDELTSYEYDEYRINVVSRNGLFEFIDTNFDMWMEFCKKSVTVEPSMSEQISALQQAVMEISMGGVL